MADVNLDRSVDLPWKISKGTYNPFTITFDEDISDLSTWRLNLKTAPDDLEADAILVLSEANELLTITSTTIAGAFTLAQSNRLRRGTYYYELLYNDSDGNTFAMFRSESFTVQNQNSSSTTSSLSVEVNLSGTTVNASVTLAGNDTSIPLSDFAAELTFSRDQELATVDGGTTTFTLAASGHKNGVEIIARINEPVAINFPVGFIKSLKSDDVSITSMNHIIFLYKEDYDGDGNDKVIYSITNETAV